MSFSRGHDDIFSGRLCPIREEFVISDFRVITPPVIEPVSLSEVKEYVKLDGEDEDVLLENLIASARITVEKLLGRSLLKQSIALRLDNWPRQVLNLPRSPIISVTAIRTVDEEGVKTTYNANNYYIIGGNKAQIIIKSNSIFPVNYNRTHGGFEVEYIAGYGEEQKDVPENIRQAILQWIAVVYEMKVPDFHSPPVNVQLLLGLPDKKIKL